MITIRRGKDQALVQHLHYNAKHQLVELSETRQDTFIQRLTFAYDALGRRIRKEVFKTADSTNYDYAEHTVWRGQQPIQTRVLDRSKRCSYDQAVIYQPGSHTPLALLDSEQGLFEIDTDHSGTPKAMYRHDAGTEVWQAQHDTYGELKQESATDARLRLNLRFQGQIHDRETGLYYNVNRDYDPSLGRYVQSDPIGLQGGLNTYGYVGGNPINSSDPFGLDRYSNLLGIGVKPSDFIWNECGKQVPTNMNEIPKLPDVKPGVFGCVVWCATYVKGDPSAQATIQATIGGGISFLFGDQ